MRTYEALFIVSPVLNDEEIQTAVKGVEKLITDNGGTIVRSEVWGKRRLAYPVKKFTEGVYVLLRFQVKADSVEKLDTHFRLSEIIVRSLIVTFDEHTLRLEEEQARRNQAQLEARAASAGRARDDDDEEDEFGEEDDMPRRRRPGPRPRPAEAKALDD